jgi:hypothetical protein
MTVTVADLTPEELQAALCDTIDAIEDIADNPRNQRLIIDAWRHGRTA